ncbi:ligand-dependent nuclear receptor-interacting factor 1-like [Acipenser oxyrinchus oxyrinchus]|uniref:Ligand-dependent nuclear receptor-interacting factor 1-like n=1 Tax=Acipenser oxyrinchus oxyrinchus TaxID=40147 RepID=A0AAD8CKP6_ACIOX|nr:ligand-dependent nuclear receptor-interacting factor 1-like [Acipenser oxyrinchus oxyrinchus]
MPASPKIQGGSLLFGKLQIEIPAEAELKSIPLRSLPPLLLKKMSMLNPVGTPKQRETSDSQSVICISPVTVTEAWKWENWLPVQGQATDSESPPASALETDRLKPPGWNECPGVNGSQQEAYKCWVPVKSSNVAAFRVLKSFMDHQHSDTEGILEDLLRMCSPATLPDSGIFKIKGHSIIIYRRVYLIIKKKQKRSRAEVEGVIPAEEPAQAKTTRQHQQDSPVSPESQPAAGNSTKHSTPVQRRARFQEQFQPRPFPRDEPSVAGGLIGRPAVRSDREFLKLFGIDRELRIPVKQCEEWAEKNFCTAEREEEVADTGRPESNSSSEDEKSVSVDSQASSGEPSPKRPKLVSHRQASSQPSPEASAPEQEESSVRSPGADSSARPARLAESFSLTGTVRTSPGYSEEFDFDASLRNEKINLIRKLLKEREAAVEAIRKNKLS